MTLARCLADVLTDHVVFEVECIDRMYLMTARHRVPESAAPLDPTGESPDPDRQVGETSWAMGNNATLTDGGTVRL